MTIQDTNSSRGRKTLILGAGLVAIAAIVAYVGFDYPPASDDAAGTIVPANRYRADANTGAPTGDEADQLATGDIGAVQSEAADAANAAAANKAASNKAADAAASSKAASNKAADAAASSKAASNKAADAAAASKAADAAAATK